MNKIEHLKNYLIEEMVSKDIIDRAIKLLDSPADSDYTLGQALLEFNLKAAAATGALGFRLAQIALDVSVKLYGSEQDRTRDFLGAVAEGCFITSENLESIVHFSSQALKDPLHNEEPDPSDLEDEEL